MAARKKTTTEQTTETEITPQRELDQVKAEEEAHRVVLADLRDQLTTAEAALDTAERAAVESADDSPEWLAFDAATTRVSRLQAKCRAAEAKSTALEAVVAEKARAILEAEFDKARERSGDAALRDSLEEAVVLELEIREKTKRRNEVLYRAVNLQWMAVDFAKQIGARLGMDDREVTARLTRDRGPIGYSSGQHDFSVARPQQYVSTWLSLLADSRTAPPPKLDIEQQRAARTGLKFEPVVAEPIVEDDAA